MFLVFTTPTIACRRWLFAGTPLQHGLLRIRHGTYLTTAPIIRFLSLMVCSNRQFPGLSLSVQRQIMHGFLGPMSDLTLIGLRAFQNFPVASQAPRHPIVP